MKLTLLELTQNILSAMDSDEVNSISDTTEATQVAHVIRTTYYNILSRADLPEHKRLFQLDASGDNDLPVLMSKPTNVTRIEWIKYNSFTVDDSSEPNYQYVTILPIAQFLDMTLSLNTTEDNVETMVLDDATYIFQNDRAPTYCTVVDDQYIIFDAYDNEVDTTLQSSKTLCFGLTHPTFLMENDYVPEIDERQFPLLLNEAKSLAFYELKQTPHEKAEIEAKRQWRTLQRTKSLEYLSDFDQLPNFGRK